MYIMGKIIKFLSIGIASAGFMGFMLLLVWLLLVGGHGVAGWLILSGAAKIAGVIGYFGGELICYKACERRWKWDHGGTP